tara:strand:+ start:959 stop:1153 length:195 start_codon:yes stop_codon:yes gene_type:complete
MNLGNQQGFSYVIVNMDIKTAHVMVKGVSVEYRKCSRCGQHNENIMDDTCFECREFEYQLNLGE